jgi:glycerol kinase
MLVLKEHLLSIDGGTTSTNAGLFQAAAKQKTIFTYDYFSLYEKRYGKI